MTIELKNGLNFRLRSKKSLKNRDGTNDWFLGVYDGELVSNGGNKNDNTIWVLNLSNSTTGSSFITSKDSKYCLGIDEGLNMISDADKNGNGLFIFDWQPNGRVCIQSVLYANKKNRTGKFGPHLGIDPNGGLIGNAGTGEWGQFDIILVDEKESGSPSNHGASTVSSNNNNNKNDSINNNKSAIPNSNPSIKLLTDFTKHRELWGERFYIEQKFTKSVKARLATMIRIPNLHVKKWSVVVSAPPTPLQTQMIKSAKLTITDNTGNNEISKGSMVKAKHHFILKAVARGIPKQHKIHAYYDIEADLYSISLKKISNDTTFMPMVQPLSQEERLYYLQTTNFINYNTPQFQQWVQSNQLHPILLNDGSVESLLCYCYRVFLFIKLNFEYVFAKDVVGGSRKATDTIQHRKTDCGGFAILYSSILRMHGIPTRILIGRWALSGTAEKQKVHVVGEFYADGLGWCPFDPACAITGDKTEPFTKFFAKNSGEFITMHIEHGIHGIDNSIDDKHQTIEFLQSTAFWVEGDGNFNGQIVENLWTVEKVEK
ncbi:hypothetical protein DICPUDRAFT_88882 [Dictyostelium purpureum]|uniref:Transglutaminase-like domain-containing protein n=1 Tax=Dictyostelium purpureum TaxID=5786 RepID=F0ZS89_DICPU|nr:uncharacterized protein DICPUDRAFT_88882 [Dictyostelium purpureum]EGC33193.1 hypothetical protein DICPUDRAFT_88882 [Dictyostelium purpureum]|eukprot:XP_003290275.1 hypothetical protein DICPUDRAFT_88882 [Dictyostelium purpureum]